MATNGTHRPDDVYAELNQLGRDMIWYWLETRCNDHANIETLPCMNRLVMAEVSHSQRTTTLRPFFTAACLLATMDCRRDSFRDALELASRLLAGEQDPLLTSGELAYDMRSFQPSHGSGAASSSPSLRSRQSVCRLQ